MRASRFSLLFPEHFAPALRVERAWIGNEPNTGIYPGPEALLGLASSTVSSPITVVIIFE
jgi:hypothetical protein